MNKKANRWGPTGSESSRRSGEARGRERCAGLLAGLAVRVGPAYCCTRKLGWLAAARQRTEQAEPAAGLLPFFFLFLFYFSSPLFEFQFGLKFEFKIGVP